MNQEPIQIDERTKPANADIGAAHPSIAGNGIDSATVDATTPAEPSQPNPIADLTYRNYDGPLRLRSARWMIIAIARIRYLKARWWFWSLMVLGTMPYFIVGLLLYVQTTFSKTPQAGNPLELLLDRTAGQRFANLFYQAMSWQGLWLFTIALAAGAGSIALDNRTNALQVYLSKPLTKRDYLFGKWMGIFMTVFAATVIPAVVFYLYLLMSYSSDGLLKQEPWLLPKVIVAAMIPGALHASLLVGISAWSKTPLFAGVVYAGAFFVMPIISTMVWIITTNGHPEKGTIIQHLSIGGIIGGLNQNVLGVTMHLTHFRRKLQVVQQLVISPPDIKIMLVIGLTLAVAGIIAARARIRAVEVVRG